MKKCRNIYIVAITILAVYLLSSRSISASEQEEAISVLKQCLQARLSIATGQCRVTGIVQDHLSAAPTPVSMEYTFDFGLPAYKIVTSEDGVYLRTPEFAYHTSHSRLSIYRRSLDELPDAKPAAFDIRSLGLLYKPHIPVADVSLNYHLLLNRYSNGVELQLDRLEGLYKISFSDSVEAGHFKSRCHCWVDPSKGFNTVKFEVDHPSKAPEILYRSQMEWEQQAGFWVITRLRQETGPSIPVFQLDWKLDWTSVNESIPSRELTTNSLIEDGGQASVYVMSIDSDRPIEIGIISNKRRSSNVGDVKEPAPVGYSRMLVYSGILLASVGIAILLFKQFARR
jgi:hypothetical protein